MQELKALIFDFDGTLAETERDGHRVAFNRAFREVGLDWEWDERLYGGLLGVSGGKERIARFAGQFAPDVAARPDFDAFIADLHERKTRHFGDIVAAGAIPLRPGVRRLLAEAQRAGLMLAIATTASRKAVDFFLEHALGAAAAGMFAAIGAGDAVARKKPAPDVYRWVLDRLSLPAAACLAIEDSAIGLAAARAAGLVTLIAASDYTRADEFGGAIAVLTDLGEPGAPHGVLAGHPQGRGCADLAALRAWHREGAGL